VPTRSARADQRHEPATLTLPAPVGGSPLLHAALALVPPSATGDELERRFEQAGAALAPAVAGRLLEELADLGLVRAGRRGPPGGTRYVTTTLGARTLAAGLQGDAAVPLAELERLRTDLLSTIAHELRTPLTSVRTGVGLLLEPTSQPTEAQRRALLESIERNAERMQRLVGDILELSRFRSGSVNLQLRRFRAGELATTASAAIAPLAAERGQSVEVAVAVPGHTVYGDRRRLEQALLNLLSNAQRFSPDGGRIDVEVAVRGPDTTWTVTDRGPGIAEADRARLFERFFVGRTDRAGAQEGVGLGLPTALAIAQAHGGTIEVRSSLGGGSSFTLVVPSSGPEDEP
jgi:signal transduction histidine kinase